MQVGLIPRLWAILLSTLLLASTGHATWSIVVVNTRTGEVCIASATCLAGFNLRQATPVLVPGVGGGAAQSFLDNIGNRLVMHDSFLEGKSPDEILQIIDERDTGFQFRQYGMVDMQGRAATFTGNRAGGWAGGVTGQDGDFVYAIQGNVLAGQAVVDQCEIAFLSTPGDLAEKVMAAMEAADAFGGDGRCSCSQSAPESCGAPPASFTHSAYCAYLLVARTGDPKKDCDLSLGCARGKIYLGINIKNLDASDPEPIGLMRAEYDQWRLDRAGKVDAIESLVMAPTKSVSFDDRSPLLYEIELYDLDGMPLTTGGANIDLEHQANSAGLATLGQVTDHANGSYTVEVLPGAGAGVDHFAFRVDDGVYAALLWPAQSLVHEADVVAPIGAKLDSEGLPNGAEVVNAYVHPDGLRAWTLAPLSTSQVALLRSERSDRTQDFAPPVEVLVQGGPGFSLRDIWVSDDELRLTGCARDPFDGVLKLYSASRLDVNSPFTEVVGLDELNTGLGESAPWLSANELEIVFQTGRSGQQQLFRATRLSAEADWFEPRELQGLPIPARAPSLLDGDTRLAFFAPGAGDALQYAEREADGMFRQAQAMPGLGYDTQHRVLGWANDRHAAWLQSSSSLAGSIWVTPLAVGSLHSDLDSISAAAGGSIQLDMAAGSTFALAAYEFVVGNPTPSSPYLDLVLPLQTSTLTQRARSIAANGGLPGWVGQLDASGSGQVTLNFAAGQLQRPELIGRTVALCFIAELGGSRFVSQSAALTILP